MLKKLTAVVVGITFLASNLQCIYAQDFNINQLPVPGSMVGISAPFSPLSLKGLIVNPQKPLEFQFIVDAGSDAFSKSESTQLIKYFMAGLTIPAGDLWVNLSPYEKNRIVPQALGQTGLGRDLLAQDYILKQLSASLIYPEKDLGKAFWARVYAKAQKEFGTTNIPVNTFNKVWILPNQAEVYENGSSAYITKSTLKVMLDEDYLATQKHNVIQNNPVILSEAKDLKAALASQIIRSIILPEIEKEVNTGKNFAPLRQIYQALILAKWYKETIQNGLLDTLYANKNKIVGVNVHDPAIKEKIYNRYLQAYKKGAFNYIKESSMPDGQLVPKKYFSGGIMKMGTFTLGRTRDKAMFSKRFWRNLIIFTVVLAAEEILLPYPLTMRSYFSHDNQKIESSIAKNQDAIDEMVNAAARGDISTVEKDLKSGFNIESTDSVHHYTALMEAAHYGQDNTATYLLNHDANPNAQINQGFTPLMLAVMNNHKSTYQLLRMYGANPRVQTKDGQTVSTIAQKRRMIESDAVAQQPSTTEKTADSNVLGTSLKVAGGVFLFGLITIWMVRHLKKQTTEQRARELLQILKDNDDIYEIFAKILAEKIPTNRILDALFKMDINEDEHGLIVKAIKVLAAFSKGRKEIKLVEKFLDEKISKNGVFMKDPSIQEAIKDARETLSQKDAAMAIPDWIAQNQVGALAAFMVIATLWEIHKDRNRKIDEANEVIFLLTIHKGERLFEELRNAVKPEGRIFKVLTFAAQTEVENSLTGNWDSIPKSHDYELMAGLIQAMAKFYRGKKQKKYVLNFMGEVKKDNPQYENINILDHAIEEANKKLNPDKPKRPKFLGASQAMISPDGGIDLNQINISHNGKIQIRFDPAQLKEFLEQGFEGFQPVVTNVKSIENPLTYLTTPSVQ